MTKFKSITILSFLLLGIFSGCKNTKEEEAILPTNSVSSAQSRTTSWVNGTYTGKGNTAYSFSIRKFTDCPPTPLIIAFHGGGFTNGAKESMIPNALNTEMNINVLTEAQLEQEGIAYAIPNYGLLKSYTGVRNPLDDCKAFVEYMHEHAATYNIDPNKIILMGYSAGASAALWIGLQAQPGVKGIVAISPQANLNILQWGGQIFAPFGNLSTFNNNFNFSAEYITKIYGTTNQVQIQAYSVNNQLNFLNLIDNSDPELYLASITTSPNDILHHACHVAALKQKADEKSLTARIQFTSNPLYVNNVYPEKVIQFCVRKFN